MYGSYLFNKHDIVKPEDKIRSFQIGLDGLPYAVFGDNCYSFDYADLIHGEGSLYKIAHFGNYENGVLLQDTIGL
jgi:hypothetical protein